MKLQETASSEIVKPRSTRPEVMGPAAEQVVARILEPNIPADATRLTETITYPECGAIVTFTGNVRLTEDGHDLMALDYEHHPAMAVRELEKVLREALDQFDIRCVACEHSTGRIGVQQASVAVAVAADHRQAAFDACEHIMNRLKQTVPIWKKPVFAREHATRDRHNG